MTSCTLSAEVCENFLGSSPEALTDEIRMARYGSRISSIVGVNFHVANVLTAIYLATYQDCPSLCS
ncbi:hypothetical protein [Candidatus Coxiella mudrowiae]|uniref:hypothetical protein n=1 Tax=Candidatus Coxiella mudrowiae TaxID=2054173 RepID=UPI001FD4CBF4|nr:hypothetical protein [Candidatus Coxiella mudrowiae]